METINKEKQNRAKKKVEELKGFYRHLAVYLVVNSVISIAKIIQNVGDGEAFTDAFFDFGTFTVWVFWGIGLAFHAAKTFSYNPFFNRDWEERQIRKFMEEERKETEKFK
ncbi:MAG: 2TM domain-containing protein [Flavobacteriales bacterium]|nr:MAG: 2TM domain-containing protein [Flavobacteriales bacterium]